MDLREALLAIDGRSYREYRRLEGKVFSLGAFDFVLEHAQGDPFAAPSRVRIDVPAPWLALPDPALRGRDARRAAADFLHRGVSDVLRRGTEVGALRGERGAGRGGRDAGGERGSGRGGRDAGGERGGRRGSGGSGRIGILSPGQEVLERSALTIAGDGGARLRLTVGLPAAGRRILGRAAAELIVERLPLCIEQGLAVARQDREGLLRHIQVVEDQVALRGELASRDWVAFLREGALLARASGVDDRPMAGGLALEVPEGLAAEVDLPHLGRVRGLAIPRGVTLIVGGGYHGKSTLLDALARSVYDHVPGDGREGCATDPGAVCIRAEDGRSVEGVDLRGFIDHLPLGRSTENFRSEDASGSTSQAAAIVEALEVGATSLLIDEDTAATNFMIRDERMRRMVPGRREPITPFIDHVRSLHRDHGVSSVLVVGGAGDYLDVADCVVCMEEYRPQDATRRAREIAAALPRPPASAERGPDWIRPVARRPAPRSFDPRRGRRSERVRSRGTRSIEFGSEEVDVSFISQIVDPAQCRFIADVLLQFSRGLCDGERDVATLVEAIEQRVAEEGIASVTEATFGDRALARRFEVAAALNRLRSLRLVRPDGSRG
jgi:predicted ABC-class ATPase